MPRRRPIKITSTIGEKEETRHKAVLMLSANKRERRPHCDMPRYWPIAFTEEKSAVICDALTRCLQEPFARLRSGDFFVRSLASAGSKTKTPQDDSVNGYYT